MIPHRSYTRDERDQFPDASPPPIRVFSRLDATIGASYDPCWRCKCPWVNVGCPKHWPVETVMLTCFACGRVVAYVDGLLLVSVKTAIADYEHRPWVIKHRTAKTTSNDIPNIARMRELISMGRDGGLSDADIAEALEIDVEDVSDIGRLA